MAAADASSSRSLTAASGLVLGALGAAMLVGALLGAAFGSWGIGLLIGALAGIPLGAVLVYVVYGRGTKP
jgi:hypothetical protein